MLRIILALFVAFVSSAAADDSFHDIDGGWHEAWLGVSDIERMEGFFQDVAGWRKIKSGKLDAATLAYLAPDASAGRYAVMRSDDYPQGWVRLIELEGLDRAAIRSNAQAWDTGGVFSLMTRSADAARNLADAEKLGWTAFNDPYDFGFGPLKLRNLVLRGPDGVNIAIYEWVEPKRDDAPPVGAISKFFNAMQMVADIDKSVAFYADGLGFRIIQRGEFVDSEEAPTNFALPVNYSTKIPREFAILVPEKGNDEAGRVELMHFAGFEGRDLSGRASLENLGIVSLLFPVGDLETAKERLSAAGAIIVRTEAEISLPPYGRARAITAASPEGALLTFFEPVAD